MPEKSELDTFYQKLAQEIQLSETARNTVKRTFDTIENLIELKIDDDIKLITFPQGSCSLGTTIKPLRGSDEDFDVDLVVALKNKDNKDIEAEDLKKLIGNILSDSSVYADKLEERGRAWCITYCQSHIDVVPALIKPDESMSITDKKDNGKYRYVPSDPQGLTHWFKNKCRGNLYSEENLQSEPIHPYVSHTILQKVVQILKYHRNVVCKELPEKAQPISMLITIIAAELYNNESDLFDALTNISYKFPEYLENHKDGHGNYKIYNPIDEKDEFTDKWLIHPERKDAFVEWASEVYNDLISGALNEGRISYSKRLNPIFGNFVTDAYKAIGSMNQADQYNGNMSYTEEGVEFGESKNGTTFKRNTFWGN